MELQKEGMQLTCDPIFVIAWIADQRDLFPIPRQIMSFVGGPGGLALLT
jgi:hypothetical protein